MASADKSVDDEIDSILGGESSASASNQLEELKKKMGMSNA